MPTIYSMTQTNYGMYRFAQKSGYSLFGGMSTAGNSLFGTQSSRASKGLPSLLNAQGFGSNAYALMNLKANTRAVLKSYHEASDGFYKTFDTAMNSLSKTSAALKNTNFNVTGATETDTKKNTEDALKNVKDFVSDYNDTIKMFGDYSDVSSRASGMEKLFGDASYKADTLRQVGITVNSTSGTLSVNDAALTKALKEEPSRVENILGKNRKEGRLRQDAARQDLPVGAADARPQLPARARLYIGRLLDEHEFLCQCGYTAVDVLLNCIEGFY